MSLSEGQLFSISVAERVSSAVSLISAGTAALTFLWKKSFRTPINRLIFYALCGNIILNIATLISKSSLEHGVGSSLCSFQAFLLQWLFPADALWALCIAWNVYLRFFYRYDSKQLRRLEWKYILFCYFLPFIPALTLLFIHTPSKGHVYGSSLFECWIALPWNTLRIALLYGPVWLVITVIIAIYVRVGFFIYSHLKQLRALGMTGDWTEDINRIANAPSTDIHEMTPTGSSRFHGLSHIYESGAFRQQTPSGHSIHRDSSTLVRVGSDSNLAAWAYARYSFLFFVALLVTWVPSTINRLSTLIDPHFVSFGMNYAAAFVIPLQGFWNSVIYITISRREFKALLGHHERSSSHEPIPCL